ncbi:fungal-specific transcription factor domain-containing protein [Whalleya microplaca]|nr:fungal-specific transcription factor domain-containing protein [Whalleya microplaca]
MFTTLLDPSPARSPRSKPGESIQGSESPEAPQPPRPRQKRSQVTRASDWCRVHRTKCDSNRPCFNCLSRGGQCSNNRMSEVRTLPHAFREIERLNERIQELEKEIEEERSYNGNISEQQARTSNSLLLTPPSSSWTPSSVTVHPSGQSPEGQGLVKKYYEGIHTSTARSPEKTWYGPSSLLYFINRMNAFMASTLQQHLPEHYMQPNSASRLLHGPTSPPEKMDDCDRTPYDDPIKAKEYLTPTQEEYFLDLFWQSYHTSLLILDEVEFKQHYRCLWAESKKNRKPSALVDIVIAVCMQYGMARGQGHQASCSTDVDTNDATIAGRWHYRRCQNLLACELESPTLATLQCNILSVIWLCCASFQNMADSTLALTTRMAQMLGLHLPSPPDTTRRERELRNRIWWSIYVLETKTSMKLGRPFLLNPSDVICDLPGDDHEVAALSGSNFAPLGEDVTWLSWNLHNSKLVFTARNIHTAFYGKFSEFLHGDDTQAIHDMPMAMDPYAVFLDTHMKALDRWLQDVPDALKTQRKNQGVPFSTDRTPLDVEQFAPLWVQRQRLLLELLYHNLCTSLYRPFISFRAASSSQSLSLAESCANRCASHAMALTHIMRQVLATTDILAGWHEAFQWQWNSAVTLIGFVLAYPHRELTRTVRDAIGASIEVLGIFGNNFAVGASAANVVRGLSATVDHVVSQPDPRPQSVDGAQRSVMHGGQATGIILHGEQGHEVVGESGTGFPDLDEETIAAMQGILSGSMDMAFAVDSYNSTNLLWPTMNA